ncbi:MAG: response regulator [Actinomycetes bacterium]
MSNNQDLERIARILVVEDDDDQRTYLMHVLRRLGNLEPIGVGDPESALELLANETWDLLITDLVLPGRNGLNLADEAQDHHGGLPVIVVTAHPSFETAVEAVRAGVSDFLVKPLDADRLLAAVDRALSGFHRVTSRVLAIGAHPDDVELGCGGALALHRIHGDEVTILTLSQGAETPDLEHRLTQAALSAQRLGATLIMHTLRETMIAESPMVDELIAAAISEIRPDTVYVHTPQDVVTDHRAVNASTRRVARAVPRLLCYQSPSSTVDFHPVEFIGIDNGIDSKLGALGAFLQAAPDREYLSPEMVRATARYWGRFASAKYAEPFEVVRDRLDRRTDRLDLPIGRPTRAGGK